MSLELPQKQRLPRLLTIISSVRLYAIRLKSSLFPIDADFFSKGIFYETVEYFH